MQQNKTNLSKNYRKNKFSPFIFLLKKWATISVIGKKISNFSVKTPIKNHKWKEDELKSQSNIYHIPKSFRSSPYMFLDNFATDTNRKSSISEKISNC